MFDGDENTWWHSRKHTVHTATPFGVEINFKHYQMFGGIILTKPKGQPYTYNQVCLIIGGVKSSNLCTTNNRGEPFLVGNDIIWRVGERFAKKDSFQLFTLFKAQIFN